VAKVFQENRTNEIGVYVIFLAFIAMSVHMLTLGFNIGYFFIAGGLYLLWYMLFRNPYRVTVESDKITVQYRLVHRDIRFSEIQDVNLVPGSATWPRSTRGVELMLTSNRKLLLGGGYGRFWRDSTGTLVVSIQEALNRYKREHGKGT